MKFSEIVGLHKYFQPVYNIDNETPDYWKQFIPNNNFYDILDTTITAIQSTELKDKLSVWMVGRYGTGKSHASGVIKHLLWDNIEAINDYLEDSLTNHRLREKIRNFRKKQKILPVVLVGIGNVINARTLSLEVERAVKSSLKESNINIQTKGDFDRMIDKINDEYLSWETIIDDNQELKMIVNDKNEMINRLGKEDIELLIILENIFNKRGTHFSHEKISKWLEQVSAEVVNQGYASGIIIFWDEFTSILDKQDVISELLDEIQSIAELSTKNNVYLYLISHRDYDQFPAIQEVMDKVKGRFHTRRYPMVAVTTYQILSAAIQKNGEWNSFKEKVFNNQNIIELINGIADTVDSDANTKGNIKDLYPIHPYTAYLSTFLANNLGSTQRSIFNFLYDEKHGFIKFINNEINDDLLLTADYLWDYYADVLESDPEDRFMQVLERFNTYKNQLESIGNSYQCVFKGVLLLNTLYRITDTTSAETHKINPNTENIKSLFIGTFIEIKVDEVLKYLDEKGIIQKSPSNLYEIASTSLPKPEVEIEKEKLKNQYSDIVKVIDFENNKLKLENLFNNEAGVLREVKILFFPANTNEHIVKNKLNKEFEPSYTLDFAIFLLLEDNEENKAKRIIENLIKEDDFRHISFVIINTPFEIKNYNNFIEHRARSEVFNNHNFKEDSIKSENYAKQTVENWIYKIKYIQIFHSQEINKIRDIASIGNYINDKIASSVYKFGIDVLNIKTETVWRNQNAKKATEYILTAQNRNDIENKPGQYNYIPKIFKDVYEEYIITNSFELKKIDNQHPVKEIVKAVDEKINKIKSRASFNLADELRFLTQPPYGIYTNILNMALLGYVLRPYIGQLYLSNTGRLIEREMMRDKIGELFECWQKNRNCDKLNFRFGTQEEKELVKILSEIFKLEGISGIQDIRWNIKKSAKSYNYPLWSVKFTINNSKIKSIIDEIDNLIFNLDDTDIDLELTNKLLLSIKDLKLDLIIAFKEENFERGFLYFIKNIEGVHIDDNELTEVLEYIYQNEPEEMNWKESDVREKVKDWKLKKLQDEKNKDQSEDDNVPKDELKDEDTEEQKSKSNKLIINRIKNKISSYKGNIDSLKDKLNKIIEENSEIAEIIDKYF